MLRDSAASNSGAALFIEPGEQQEDIGGLIQNPRPAMQALPGVYKILGLSLALRLSSLHAEGTAATAGGLDVGVLEFEPCAFQGFHVIDLGPVQVHERSLVDKDF